MNRIIINVFMFIFMLATIPSSYAFDNVTTHRDITEKSVLSSRTDQILKDRLGFMNGIKTAIAYKGINLTGEVPFIPYSSKIADLIKEGSYTEDVPACRASNHFHNPINNSGLTDFLEENNLFALEVRGYFLSYCLLKNPEYIPWTSTLKWANDYQGNQWNWLRTRNAYYFALTSKSRQERENYYASTFYGLGSVLHLLQDMAVPAHTRNDFMGHLQPVPDSRIRIEGFENYVKNNYWLVKQSPAVDIVNLMTGKPLV